MGSIIIVSSSALTGSARIATGAFGSGSSVFPWLLQSI